MTMPDTGPTDDPNAPALTLGERYRDVVTGFEGVAVIYTEHLNGCRQIILDPGIDEKGDLRQQHAFDEQRLVTAGAGERIATDAPPGNAAR